MFLNEQERKIKDLYTKLSNLKEGKRILENAMHRAFYNKPVYQKLFDKLNKINSQIKQTKKELEEEKKAYAESRKNIWKKL